MNAGALGQNLDFVAQAISFLGTAVYGGNGNKTVGFATLSGVAAVNDLSGLYQLKLATQPFIGTGIDLSRAREIGRQLEPPFYRRPNCGLSSEQE